MDLLWVSVESALVEVCAWCKSPAVFVCVCVSVISSISSIVCVGAPLWPTVVSSLPDHVDYFGVYSGSGRSWWELGMSAAPRLETADRSVPCRAGADHSLCQGVGTTRGVLQCVQLPAVAPRHRPVLLRRDRAAVRPGVGQHAGGPSRLQV